jgi:antitoxin CptB
MPAPTTDDPTDIRRKRLLFRAWHRGTREADLILGSFAERHLAGFDDAAVQHFESLLEVPDAELFDWIAGRAAPPPEHDTEVTRLLLVSSTAPDVTCSLARKRCHSLAPAIPAEAPRTVTWIAGHARRPVTNIGGSGSGGS